MNKINDLIKKFGIKSKDVCLYGDYIAKIKPILTKPNTRKKLVLVTAISPTPAGEGKTTIAISLNDAFNALHYKSIVALREPSMGPVFGVKGGANGGGAAQVVPKDEIDLHFTGDLHAITAANNLIAACIDNHIYWGNELKINPLRIVWRRVLDVNDRALRNVEITIDSKRNIKYRSGFDITVASELMAIFCLANSVEELRKRIDEIIVAYDFKDKPIYVKDLAITNAIIKILQNALWPNVVQSLEGHLALIHGGPFANIAHGCNSIFATKTAMNLADITVTEAGFGSDLGAEKFLDIVCDCAKIEPNAIVLVASIRSLKMHGGLNKDQLKNENIGALKNGINNLNQHIKNLYAFNKPIIIAINEFDSDSRNEKQVLEQYLQTTRLPYAFTKAFAQGSKGSLDLAKKVCKAMTRKTKLKPVYHLKTPLFEKIQTLVKQCYGALRADFSPIAKQKLDALKNKHAYICMAKTPLTFSDDPKEIVINQPFTITIRDVIVANGANFIILLAGEIFRMPGLPKEPAACKM